MLMMKRKELDKQKEIQEKIKMVRLQVIFPGLLFVFNVQRTLRCLQSGR